MPSLYLIRHGRTAWNSAWRIQGHEDVPLDEEGRMQARALGEALKGVPLGAVYASPLARAQETASLIAAPHGLPLRLDDRLMERNWGQYQGMRREEAALAYAQADDLLRRDPANARPPGGESYRELYARAEAALREITAGEEGHVAVVCHGGTIVAGLMALMGLDSWPRVRFVIENASISLLDVRPDGGVVTHYVNRCDHLA